MENGETFFRSVFLLSIAKLSPFLRPFFFANCETKKNLGEETFRETNSQKVPSKLVTRVPLLQKKPNFGHVLCLLTKRKRKHGKKHRKRKKGKARRGREKTWEKKKNLFVSSAPGQQSKPLPPQRRFGPMVRPPLSLRLWSRRHSHPYPVCKRAPGIRWRRSPNRGIV